MSNLPKFSRALLHPRYWLLWLGIGFLWLLVQLPYPVIYRLGTALGRLAMRVMKSRARIARRNLELCFPEMSAADREALLVKNFESLGMGLMETGMAWFWPTHRVARWTETSGVNEVVELLEEKQGILLIGIHFLTLEMGARMYGMFTPGIGVYRPNDNPLIDWLQTWGRLRSNKTMLDRKNLKGMVRALKEGKFSGTRRIMTTVRPAASSPRCLPSNRRRPPPVPGCWRKCPGRRLCRLFRGASPTAWGMN
jgi:KDO2-lipid IV(A) lauroyltransferase